MNHQVDVAVFIEIWFGCGTKQALLDPGRYAVALVSRKELHLNPVRGILHVKPAFQYLDKSDKNLKKLNRSDAATDQGALQGVDLVFSFFGLHFLFRHQNPATRRSRSR